MYTASGPAIAKDFLMSQNILQADTSNELEIIEFYLEEALPDGGSYRGHYGVNVAKVFILIYRLPGEEYLFRRFPGVEGSLYLIGGVGVNYLRSGDTVVAPIRLGAGWRQGVSAGYMDFTERAHYNPF